MKISVAQIQPIKGNISANIENHKKFINLAVSHKVECIIFPELSITGYEPELAKALAINENDNQFDDFQDISNKNKITIGIGAPTKTSTGGVLISMLIFQPNSLRQIYSKQQLHADEFPYFVSGNKQLILTVGNKKIAPAICYESLQTNHSENAIKLGAEIYLASVAKSQNGVDKALIHYSAVAKKFSIPVLMSNCVGYCDNFESVGQSAIWTKNGDLLKQLDYKTEGILVFDTATEEAMEKRI